MDSTVVVEKVTPIRDERGWVFEPIAPAQIGLQRNVHVVMTEPGRVRGNHFHTRGTEITVVEGPALVRLREQDKVSELRIEEGEFMRLTIPPNVAHSFQNTGNRPTLLIAFNTLAHDRSAPDLTREVLISP